MKLTATQFLHRLLRSSDWGSADKAVLFQMDVEGRTREALDIILRDNRIDAACRPTNILREDPSPEPTNETN